MSRPVVGQTKAWLVRRYGLGPVLNRKCQLRSATSLPRLWAHERRETRPGLVEAPIVTVIATIGRESLVPAVESAVAQTVGRRNHVLVVTDGPAPVPALPAGVRVLATSRNCGVVGVVRNIGIRSSRSGLVAFLDDDNVWEPGHLESCERALALTGAELVYSSAERVRDDGSLFDVIGRPWDRDAVRVSNFVDASAVVVRRLPGLRFSRAGRTLGEQFSEDWELAYRWSKRHPVAWTGEVTLRYAISERLVELVEGMRLGDGAEDVARDRRP